jgi:hypothetical protein
MKKKLVLAFGLALVACAVVFAQVCLSNSAARVIPSGSTVGVMNTMSNVSINVEIAWEKTTGGRTNTGSVWAYELAPLARTSVSLPNNAKYTGYTVWSCN